MERRKRKSYEKIKQCEVDDAVRFINKLFNAENVKVKVLKNSDSIDVIHKGGTTDRVFAAYNIADREILIPDNFGERNMFFSGLFHEYIHAYDNDNGNRFSEEDIEDMASNLCEVYRIMYYK